MKSNTHFLKKPVKHILGIACTGHGASIAYLGPNNSICCSVLDRWIGTKHVLMFARDELRDIIAAKSVIDKNIKGALSYSFGRFPESAVFEEKFPAWLEWLLNGFNISSKDIDLVVTSDSHFATCKNRLGPYLKKWLPSAHIVSTVEHQTIHQCQAFFQSGFNKAAVLTLDTCGEKLERTNGKKISGTIGVMQRNGDTKVIKEFLFPESSAGLIYAATNHHIGFRQGEEGKTMGLAPYGSSELFDKLYKHLKLQSDGGFTFLNYTDFKSEINKYVSPREHDKTAEISDKHKNVAYAGQALIQLIVTNAFQAVVKLTGLKDLTYAGGVALNSVANDIAFRRSGLNNLYVAPNPGDAGQALGCALFGAYNLVDKYGFTGKVSEYTGPEYSSVEMKRVALSSGFNVLFSNEPEGIIAECIANGFIVARFAGRAEFGPRALGNRSILCDPRRKEMKDYLNTHVKHRELFRPFAPTVLFDYASDWFDIKEKCPYMTRVVAVRKEVIEKVQAIVHVDGTARVQTLEHDDNPDYWRLIESFRKITGIPLLLNTSFNVAGKPIVETPEDAVNSFKSTSIDLLLLDKHIISKEPLDYYLKKSTREKK